MPNDFSVIDAQDEIASLIQIAPNEISADEIISSEISVDKISADEIERQVIDANKAFVDKFTNVFAQIPACYRWPLVPKIGKCADCVHLFFCR